jgi:anti-sigma-K factor RskA
MELSSFIQSGLLESYALSQCSPEEQQLVEDMLAQHAEARAELQKIELALEQFAATQAVTPPAWMRGRIEALIQKNAPASSVLDGRTGGASSRFWTLALGMVALGCAALLLYRSMQMTRLSTTLEQAKTQLQDCETRSQAQQGLQAQIEHLTAPATRPIDVPGTVNGAVTNVKIYYNEDTQKAFFAPMLPTLLADQDYQLWVITKDNPNPKPLNVFTFSPDLQEINTFSGEVVAFAISIEPKGGSPNGTPTEVVMLGKAG